MAPTVVSSFPFIFSFHHLVRWPSTLWLKITLSRKTGICGLIFLKEKLTHKILEVDLMSQAADLDLVLIGITSFFPLKKVMVLLEATYFRALYQDAQSYLLFLLRIVS